MARIPRGPLPDPDEMTVEFERFIRTEPCQAAAAVATRCATAASCGPPHTPTPAAGCLRSFRARGMPAGDRRSAGAPSSPSNLEDVLLLGRDHGVDLLAAFGD